jgi:RHS repeat-associated protein
MRAHTVLSVLRRCLNHWMPALAVALLLVLGGGTSWAQTAVPTGPDTQPTPAYLPPPDDPDPPAQYDDAAVVSISAPATMTPGSTAYVTVTMRNSGTTTWYPGLTTYPYRLGSQNPANNSTWGVGRVELGSTVAPGGQAVFGFTITAPTTSGTYSFSWGMLRENLAWFGAIASSTITVSAPAPVYDAQLVSASVPAQMGVGGNYNVSLTFKNTGNVTWTQSDYRIGSSSPADNTTWGFARVDMSVASVAPGQSATFNFQVHAPATAGTYLFDWGMLYELHWRFGQTTGISVTVGGANSSVTYIHTDGLGSPVARTDGAGNVISRTRYEPYGYVASGVQPTIGFTGHVNDVDTGLTYMQQRYYDPVAGRFLSIDPVTTDANTGGSFNRYAYAADNPYKYIDPDGRDVVFGVDPAGAGGNGHTTLYFQNKNGQWNSFSQGAAGQPSSGGNLAFLSGMNAKAGVVIDKISADDVPKDGLRIKTNSKQDELITDSASKSAADHNSGKVEYNLYSNNCTDASVNVVNSAGAGITVANPSTTVKPNSWIKEVKNDPKAVENKEVAQ